MICLFCVCKRASGASLYVLSLRALEIPDRSLTQHHDIDQHDPYQPLSNPFISGRVFFFRGASDSHQENDI